MSDEKTSKVRRDSMGRVIWGSCPSLPGKILKSQWLDELGIKLEEFAKKSGISFEELDKLVNKEGDMTKELAEKLGSYLKTSSQFWMNLQRNVDDFRDQQREKKELKKLS